MIHYNLKCSDNISFSSSKGCATNGKQESTERVNNPEEDVFLPGTTDSNKQRKPGSLYALVPL